MIIGLSGWARSGKDTVADILVKNHGFTKLSFAQPMRDALYALNPRVNFSEYDELQRLRDVIDTHSWDNYKDTEYGDEIRGLMQRFGTEVGRSLFGQDFWVNQALRKIPEGANVVIADTRFLNEAQAIENLGGAVWRVNRPGVVAANDHVSEHDLDNYPFKVEIDNVYGLDELAGIVKVALR